MEQYWMPRTKDFQNLRTALNNYECTNIFIRDIGSHGGKCRLNENLGDKKLTFKVHLKNKILEFLIDSNKAYDLDLKSYYTKNQMGFSLAYERIRPDNSIVMLSQGIDPYDKELPEPKSSTLRQCIDEKLLEITFKGRVHLEFYSWWQKKKDLKYWKVVLPKKGF
ncbi:MAG TPA: hypothetical protein VEC16_01790 [Alphaproteobacteria bacterium]|nr:hypothetical protein [Alphaproteobacteria bacterium]